MSTLSADVVLDGRHVLYTTMSLVFESVFYGIYALLVPFSTYILLKKGLKSRSNILLFLAMFVPFVLSSLYWAVQVAQQAVRIEMFFVYREKRNLRNITTYSTLFNAVVLFNYISSDAIVVWRSWVLCRDDYKNLLLLPMAALTFTTLCVLGTIAVKVATFIPPFTAHTPKRMTTAIDFLQVATLVWSLLTNVIATTIISHKAWRHRRVLHSGLTGTRNKSTKVERVFALLVESGIVYCLSGVTMLATSFFRLPFGTLGDIYAPINTQIAGIYPTIVIVLVGLERTLNDTTFWQASTAQQTLTQMNHSGARSHGRVSHIRFNNNPASYHEMQDEGSKIDHELTAPV